MSKAEMDALFPSFDLKREDTGPSQPAAFVSHPTTCSIITNRVTSKSNAAANACHILAHLSTPQPPKAYYHYHAMIFFLPRYGTRTAESPQDFTVSPY
jgi:hypothetical protein